VCAKHATSAQLLLSSRSFMAITLITCLDRFLLGREGGFGSGTRDESRVPEFKVRTRHTFQHGYSQTQTVPSSTSADVVSRLLVSNTYASATPVQAGFEQHLSAAEAALAKHSQGPFFLGNFGFVDLMFMPSLVRAHECKDEACMSQPRTGRPGGVNAQGHTCRSALQPTCRGRGGLRCVAILSTRTSVRGLTRWMPAQPTSRFLAEI
jgi:hypothetical protein